MKLKFLLPAFVLAAALLSGCGGLGKSSNSGSVRLVNATADYSALDLYATDSKAISNVASYAGSSFVSVGSGNQTFKLTQVGSTTSVFQVASSVTKDVNYSLVAYTTNNSLQMLTVTENETTPVSGNGQIRVFNTSAEVGSVDVYVVATGADLTTATPIASGVSSSSGFVDVAKGTYRIVVTATQDKTDIRLDIPSFTLADQQVVNLVLTKTPGGVLANGLAVVQAGDVTPYKNTSARMRLVADVASSGVATVAVNGVTLGSGMTSPAVNGAYSLVTAGSLSIAATINGSTVSVPGGATAAAGDDITLLVMGSASSPNFVVIHDDNTLAASGYSKVRLLNGINGATAGLTLTIDYSDVANGVTPGTVSTSQKVASGTGININVAASGSSTSLYTNSIASLASGSVYTVFMLGDNSAPVGFLRKDR